MDCARHAARMQETAASGTDARSHLEQAAKMGNRTAIELLEGPEVPLGMEYLWEWFQELNMARGIGVITPNGTHIPEPFTFATIASWAQLMEHEDIHPHEVSALLMLDRQYRNPAAGEKERAERKEEERQWT